MTNPIVSTDVEADFDKLSSQIQIADGTIGIALSTGAAVDDYASDSTIPDPNDSSVQTAPDTVNHSPIVGAVETNAESPSSDLASDLTQGSDSSVTESFVDLANNDAFHFSSALNSEPAPETGNVDNQQTPSSADAFIFDHGHSQPNQSMSEHAANTSDHNETNARIAVTTGSASVPASELVSGDSPSQVFSEARGSSGSKGGATSSGGGSNLVTNSAGTGLVINVIYDSSVASAPVGFTNVVAQVVQYFETHFTDQIAINIAVGYGEVGGSRLRTSALGESETYLSSFSYAQITNALATDAKDSVDNSAVASLPTIDPTGGHYWVSTAEGKALGLLGASSSIDGYVGFSSSSGIFDYNNADGVGSNQYDFYGVVAHEISEVMGRMLLVGDSIGGSSKSYDPLDLFHYSAPGVHDFSGSQAGYFSVNGGATPLNTFNTVAGGDAGDWAGATVDAFNAFANSGVVLPISSADLTTMDAIGWDAGSPSPPPSLPDLTVSNLGIDATLSGPAITFDINNIGPGAASSSIAGIYLSSHSTITASDTEIATYSTSSLTAGSSESESVSLSSIPTPSKSGTYYIGAIADSTHLVAESNENNNTATVPVILGNDSGNSLTGNSANNIILGFGGNDTLYGGAGADILMGGAGNDHFVFKALTDGMDRILDFTSGSDVIDFSSRAFGKHLAVAGANTGILDPSHFVANATGPTSTAQEFWYDTATANIYFDADGSGSKSAPIAMAHLDNVDPSFALHNYDIHLV